MYEVTLDELRAVSLGSTAYAPREILVKVWLDDSDLREPYLVAQKLQTGESAPPADPFDRRYDVDTGIEFELVVGDSLSLGTESVDVTSISGAETRTFQSGQIEIELEFSVSDVGDVDPRQRAIDQFRDGESTVNSDEFTRWQNVGHSYILERLERIATDPADANEDGLDDVFEIYQGETEFCAVTSVAFGLAHRQPRRFIEVARSLYETGGFLGNTDRLETSRSLQNSSIGDDVWPLGWLLLASLMETDNVFFDMSDSDVDTQASVFAVKYWLGELLGYDNVDYDSAQLMSERTAFERASNAVGDDGVGILHIHDYLLDDDVLDDPEENAAWWAIAGNHFVAMAESATIVDEGDSDDQSDDRIEFSVHSWGRRIEVDMEWQYIEDYIYGSISGSP